MSSTKAMQITRTFSEFAKQADYSFMDSLEPDPQATDDGDDHLTREVFSGHYVPVTPTAIPEPEYVSHSKTLFNELGLSQELSSSILWRHKCCNKTDATSWLGYRLRTIYLWN